MPTRYLRYMRSTGYASEAFLSGLHLPFSLISMIQSTFDEPYRTLIVWEKWSVLEEEIEV